MPFDVRAAASSDAQAIARLLDQLGYPVDAVEIPARLGRVSKGNRAAVFLAEQDGRVVGLATVHILSVLNRVRDVAWLTALVVDASARAQGVGRRLVESVEAFAREHGCERLSVTTQEHRSDAHAFYVRTGFEPTGRRFGKAL